MSRTRLAIVAGVILLLGGFVIDEATAPRFDTHINTSVPLPGAKRLLLHVTTRCHPMYIACAHEGRPRRDRPRALMVMLADVPRHRSYPLWYQPLHPLPPVVLLVGVGLAAIWWPRPLAYWQRYQQKKQEV